jgi:hypothetical protein
MRGYWTPAFALLAACLVRPAVAAPQLKKLVDTIPEALSDETSNDAEPSLAVEPSHPNNPGMAPRRMVAGVTTNVHGCPFSKTGLLISIDGGLNWTLECRLLGVHQIVEAGGDIMFAQGDFLHLYAVDLGANDGRRKGTRLSQLLGLYQNPFGPLALTMHTWAGANSAAPKVTELRGIFDQPVIAARGQTVLLGGDEVASSTNHSDRKALVFEVNGDQHRRVALEANRNTIGGVPVAIHPSGRMYALVQTTGAPPGKVHLPSCPSKAMFESLPDPSQEGTLFTAALRLHRVDNAAVQARKAAAEIDPNFQVLHSQCGAAGGQRLGFLPALLVDPTERGPDADTIFVAYVTGASVGALKMRIKYSLNSGQSWTQVAELPLLFNPSFAINVRGRVGLLYQQYNASTDLWDTRVQFFDRGQQGFALTPVGTNTSGGSLQLSAWQRKEIPAGFNIYTRGEEQPYLGEYDQMVSLGTTFYGIYSGGNNPAGTFPCKSDPNCTFRYQRKVSGTVLLDKTGQPLLHKDKSPGYSNDPFYFEIEDP